MFSSNDSSRHFRNDGPPRNVRPRLNTQRGAVNNTSSTAGTYRRPVDTPDMVFNLPPAAPASRPKFVPRRNVISGNVNQPLGMPNGMERAGVSGPGPQSATGMTNFGAQEHTSSDDEAIARHYELTGQVNEVTVGLDNINQQIVELKDNVTQQCEELKDNMTHQTDDLKDYIAQLFEELKDKLDNFARATEAMLQNTTQDGFVAAQLATQDYQAQDYGFKLQ